MFKEHKVFLGILGISFALFLIFMNIVNAQEISDVLIPDELPDPAVSLNQNDKPVVNKPIADKSVYAEYIATPEEEIIQRLDTIIMLLQNANQQR